MIGDAESSSSYTFEDDFLGSSSSLRSPSSSSQLQMPKLLIPFESASSSEVVSAPVLGARRSADSGLDAGEAGVDLDAARNVRESKTPGCGEGGSPLSSAASTPVSIGSGSIFTFPTNSVSLSDFQRASEAFRITKIPGPRLRMLRQDSDPGKSSPTSDSPVTGLQLLSSASTKAPDLIEGFSGFTKDAGTPDLEEIIGSRLSLRGGLDFMDAFDTSK